MSWDAEQMAYDAAFDTDLEEDTEKGAMPMTPIAIREAMHQTHYAVLCDVCHGRRYAHDQLCHKCHGDGKVIIPVERVRKPMAASTKFWILAATAIALIVTATVFILS